ncbi:MAG TPA: DUF2378 family protein [Vicinamibacteria bacterium]|nr:DUF2378 family protein [Vicinamibacteria bacterium]
MNLKGTSFASFFDFLTRRFGPSAQTQVLMAMPVEHRKAIEAGVLASGWYSVATFVCLADVAKRVLGSRDPHFHQAFGRHDAEYGLSGVHRVMLREGGPLRVLEGAQTLWSHGVDQGRLEVVSTGAGSARLHTYDCAVSTILCDRMTGYCQRAAELAGGQDVRIRKDRCALDGHPRCEWEIRWS